ncbi:MAG: DEAD/DEAH box helicase, partial [Bacteroidia bacterium]
MTQIEKYIQHLDIQQLTDLQYDTIEHAFDKANQLILSATGSGKTLAFLLPLALKIEDKKEEIQALIIVPTRELALQIEDVFKKLRTNHKVLTCYGGHSFKTEQKSFSNLPTVLIGTPGRICDHMLRSGLDISTVKHLVIDEYDKCLEFGFEDQMKFILDDVRLNSTTLSSATPLQKTPSIISFEDPLVFDYLDEASAPDLTYFEIKTSENKMQFIADL